MMFSILPADSRVPITLGNVFHLFHFVTGCEFSPDGKYFAVLERKDCKDHISIFSCDVWKMLRVGATVDVRLIPPLLKGECAEDVP